MMVYCKLVKINRALKNNKITERKKNREKFCKNVLKFYLVWSLFLITAQFHSANFYSLI